ncbi:MAG: hypothetical protein AB9869_31170 [Verrucomicrobiia bacterium]
MMLLPIVQRELRVASRKARSYWVRWPLAGIPIAFFALAAWSATQGLRWSSGAMFQFLAWYGFVYCLFGGVLATADCLSVERRQNTAGLLFLTDLRGYDIVLGKVCANSLTCFFGLLAMFPIMAIPLLLGGVPYAEFGRVVLSLVTTLLWALSLGLIVSTFGQNAFRNTASALLLACLLSFGVALFAELIRSSRRWPELAEYLGLLSPFHMHQMAITAWTRTAQFWLACGTSSFLIVAAVALSCWRLARNWQDAPGSTGQWSIRNAMERWRQWNLAPGGSRHGFRQRVLAANPFAWLASRERVSSAGLLGLYVITLVVAVWISSSIWAAALTPRLDEQFVLWLLTSVVLHVMLLAKVSWIASERIGSDRQSGALELLLCTPLTIPSITRGQWRALGRQLLAPAVIALLVHAVVFYLAGLVIAGARGWTAELVSLSWQNLAAHTPGPRWEETMALLCIIGAAVALIAHWIALGWVGMWLSLRLRQPRFAPWVALLIVIVPPWILFAVIAIGLVEYETAWSDSRWFFVLYKIAMTLQLLHDVLLSFWAARQVRTRFRPAAAGAAEFSASRISWPVLAKHAFRWASAPVAVAILLTVFHAVENRRGERAWITLQRELTERGERLDAASVMPPAVPPYKNFAQAQVISEAIASVEAAWFGRSPPGIQPVRGISLHLNGQPKGYPEQTANWMRQHRIDLSGWQKEYRGRGLVPTNTGPQSASSDILRAFDRFSGVLHEVRDATGRPLCRFGGKKAALWDAPRPYLVAIADISEVLRFRAAAELAEGEVSAAFDDLHLCLFLADSLKREPFPESHARRNELLIGAIQLVWEGFASGCWSPEQALWIQGRLSEIDRLADLPHVIRAAALSQMDYWTRRRTERMARTGLWRFTRMFSPMGWTHLNQVGVYRWLEANLPLLADPAAGRISLEEAKRASHELSRSGMVPRYNSDQVESIVTEIARVQTALNLAVTACALERYRWDRGSYPPALELLVPEYVEFVPIDVVNGQPLRYRLSPDSRFRLYSAGLNCQDDGGVSKEDKDWVWGYPALESGLGSGDN